MELRHLRYFVAVADSESVRVASSRVHITQPAISRQIHQLEEEIGVALFERLPRGLKLTEAGRIFLEETRKALATIEGGLKAAKQARDGLRGQLRIGFVENAGWDGLVPSALGRLQETSPDLELELKPLSTPEQMEELLEDQLDAGFVYLFSELPPGFEHIPLFEYNVVLAAPTHWPGLEGGRVAASSLADQPFLAFRRKVYPAYYDRLIAACTSAGLTMDIVQEVSSEAAVLSLVSAGLGVAIVNSANRGRPPARVRFIDLKDLSVPLPLSFIYKKDNANPALQRMLQALRYTLDHAAEF